MNLSQLHASLTISLRPATVEDGSFLYTLFEEARGAEFAPLALPSSALTQILRMQHRAQSRGYAIQFPDAVDNIVLRGDRCVGRLLVARDLAALHIVDVALLTAYRGMGIGTFLLQGVCEQAGAQQLDVTLSVRVDNPAQRLYARMGFTLTGGDGHSITMHWTRKPNRQGRSE